MSDIPDPRPYPVRSAVLDSNKGGLSVTICACGALLLCAPVAWEHFDACPAFAAVGDA
jgi:hypothetical protein